MRNLVRHRLTLNKNFLVLLVNIGFNCNVAELHGVSDSRIFNNLADVRNDVKCGNKCFDDDECNESLGKRATNLDFNR